MAGTCGSLGRPCGCIFLSKPVHAPLHADWRVRVLLWPDSNDCEPLCVKMRGQGGEVTDYGRTATCT